MGCTRCAWRCRYEREAGDMSVQVLVVDDEALARSRLRTLLGECTAPAATVGGEAPNAAQAMEMLLRGKFDAVLLDIHMPGADGLVLAQTLRSMAQPPAVVFVTAPPEPALDPFAPHSLSLQTKPMHKETLQANLLLYA